MTDTELLAAAERCRIGRSSKHFRGVGSDELAEICEELVRLRADVARLRAEKEAAYTALEGRLGCGDDADKAQKVLWACEAYVLTEDALPGDEFDSEDYSLPKAVAALAAQRDDERDENERLREGVTRLREALEAARGEIARMAHETAAGFPRSIATIALDAVNEIDACLAATDPETRS